MAARTLLTRRRFLLVTAGSAVAGVVAACGSDGGDPSAQTVPTTTRPEPAGTLPTNDEAELISIFDPLLEPVGLRTTRAGLYDLSQGFVRDDQGTHLALYADPIDPDGEGWDTARYIEAVVPGMAAVTPFIFDTWSGIESMDLCQEPPHREAPEPEPPIVTQVALGRSDSAAIDWERARLADLMEAQLRSPETARVRGDEEIQRHPMWIEAEAQAATRV